MPALYVMIPAALLIVAVAIYIFFWAVDSVSTTTLMARRTVFCLTTKTLSTWPPWNKPQATHLKPRK